MRSSLDVVHVAWRAPIAWWGRPALPWCFAFMTWMGAAFPAAALPPDRPWSRVETRHFEIIGAVHPKQLQAIGLRLERLHEFLQQPVASSGDNATVPLRIVVFRDDASFAPYKLLENGNPADRSGFFAPGRDHGTIGFEVESDAPLRMALHEFIHAYVWQQYGDLPLWLNEGLAEYYSTFDADDQTLQIGRPIAAHIQLLANEALLPFRDLFALDASSRAYKEDARIGIFYAESWALVHYLLSNPESRERLLRFATMPVGKNGARGAFRAVFGDNTDALEYALGEYVKGEAFTYDVIKSKLPESVRPLRAGPMTRAEVMEALGDYLLHATPWRLDDAAAHFHEALRLDAGNARAHSGLATALAKQGHWPQARTHFERGLELGRGDAIPFLLYGLAVLDSVTERTPVELSSKVLPGPVAQARALFARCAELDSSRAEAWAGFGRSFLYDAGSLADGIAALSRAHGRLPARMDITCDLMVLHLRDGNRKAAEALAADIEARAQDAADIRRAHEILQVADANREVAQFNEAVHRLNTGDLAGGIALLDKLATSAADPALRQSAQRTAAEARAAQEENARVDQLNRQIDAYNGAVRQANAGDVDRAITVLEHLIPQITDTKLAGKANTLLHELRQR